MEREVISEEKINNILNEEESEKNYFSSGSENKYREETENVVFADLTLWEKIKYIFYKAMIYLYKVRCVCCFTSVLALVNIVFFVMSVNKTVNDFSAIILVTLGMIGILSELLLVR